MDNWYRDKTILSGLNFTQLFAENLPQLWKIHPAIELQLCKKKSLFQGLILEWGSFYHRFSSCLRSQREPMKKKHYLNCDSCKTFPFFVTPTPLLCKPKVM